DTQIEVKDLKGKRLNVIITGSGKVSLSGTIEQLNVNIIGPGSVTAADMKAKMAHLHVTTKGSIVVQVSDLLTANIIAGGRVEYIGEPKIHKNIVGDGTIQPYVPKGAKEK